MLRHLPTYLIVTVITLLIWVLAESESVLTQTIRADVMIGADGDGRRILQIEPGQDFTGSVLLRLEGATSRLDLLSSSLRSAIRLVPPMPGLPAEPGQHRVDLRSVLRAHPDIRDSGVTIVDVDPPFVAVSIDEIISRDAKVVVRVPDGSITGAATPTPASVSLRLPSRMSASLVAAPEVIARIDQQTIATLPEGKYSTIPSVSLEVPAGLRAGPGGQHVQVDPAQVSVALTPRSREATRVLPSVPVQILIPPIEFNRWDISLAQADQSITDVTVTGPSELVEQTGPGGRLFVVAVVQPRFEELEQAARTGEPLVKEVSFALLPSQLRFDAKDRTVSLTVRPRIPAEAASDPAPVNPPP